MSLEDVLLEDDVVGEGFLQRLVYLLVLDGGPVEGEEDNGCLLFFCQDGGYFEGVDTFRRFYCV